MAQRQLKSASVSHQPKPWHRGWPVREARAPCNRPTHTLGSRLPGREGDLAGPGLMAGLGTTSHQQSKGVDRDHVGAAMKTRHPPSTISLEDMAAVIHFWLLGWHSAKPAESYDKWRHLSPAFVEMTLHSIAQNSPEDREGWRAAHEAKILFPTMFVLVIYDHTWSQCKLYLPGNIWRKGWKSLRALCLPGGTPAGTPTQESIREPHGPLASSWPSTLPPQFTGTSRYFPMAFPFSLLVLPVFLGKCHQRLDRSKVTAETWAFLLIFLPQAQCSLLDLRVRKAWDFEQKCDYQNLIHSESKICDYALRRNVESSV